MNEQEVMIYVFTKYFGKTDDEVKEWLYEKNDAGELILKEDATDVLISMDESRINRIKEDVGKTATTKFDEGYKKAQKEVLSKFEKDLKAKFGLETDKNGVDLVDELLKEVSRGGDLTEESIKTHPLYLKLESKTKEAFEEKIKELSTQFDDYKNGVEKRNALMSVKALAKQEFLALNPVLSQDPARAERQTNLFLKELEAYGYIGDNDTYIITNGDSRLEDAHGNPIPFPTFIKNKASEMFDFQVQGDRGSPGNTHAGAGGTKKKITKDEYNKLIAQYEKERNWEAMKELGNLEVV